MPNQTTLTDFTTTPLRQQVANALRIAAARMGANGHAAVWARATKKQRQGCLMGKRALYVPTAEHIAVVEAIPAVLSGQMEPDDAMNLLRQYDVEKQRFGQ